MDVGNYLSELLTQYGEVNVPGLGSFTQARMSAYYDENEDKFYPPYHQVQFNAQGADDDVLTDFIAREKNISIASAKYFAEKYVINLKQEAQAGEIPVANLGWFYTQDGQLAFKPAPKVTEDAVFYGYEAIAINKAKQADAVTEYIEPVTDEPEEQIIESETVKIDPIIQKNKEEIIQEYFGDDTEKTRRPLIIWLVILTGIVIVGTAIFALYHYNPAIFDTSGKNNTTIAPPAVKPVIAGKPKITDSVKKDSTKTTVNDTTAKKGAVDTTKERFEVIATSFRTIPMANKTIKNFKSIGVDAHIVTDAPGRLLKISVGTYATRKEAESARIKLVAAGKIQKDAFSLPIKPKQ
jgi:hypothetical protein